MAPVNHRENFVAPLQGAEVDSGEVNRGRRAKNALCPRLFSSTPSASRPNRLGCGFAADTSPWGAQIRLRSQEIWRQPAKILQFHTTPNVPAERAAGEDLGSK